MEIQICNLGKISYGNALELQRKLLALRQQQKIKDLLLLLEHPPVLTIGKKGKNNKTTNILVSDKFLREQQVEVFETDRGGDVTYHGPGQLIGYPIMDLTNHGKDIRKFVHNIEQVFIDLLRNYWEITAFRDPEHTGVWLEHGKITAIGFAIKRWVTMHGFAFNVNTNLSHFSWINPCGITDRDVTSLQAITGQYISWDLIIQQVIESFCNVFNLQPITIEQEQIKSYLGSYEDEKA